MSYLSRYMAGECEQVWAELQALGGDVRQEPTWSDAKGVAAETMRRVRRNVERLVERLRGMGFVFGVYPDGLRGYSSQGAWVPPSRDLKAQVAELTEMAGPLPLSLVAFWQAVGSVDFVGKHPARLFGLDPLVVESAEGVLAMMDSMEDEEFEGDGQLYGWLAPDELHKDNVSGGDPYSVALPDENADFVLLYERHGMLFVPYLRMAILKWGGFPGLETGEVWFPRLGELTEGLEKF